MSSRVLSVVASPPPLAPRLPPLLQTGSKAIFHLEAFLARFMSEYKQARRGKGPGGRCRGKGETAAEASRRRAVRRLASVWGP